MYKQSLIKALGLSVLLSIPTAQASNFASPFLNIGGNGGFIGMGPYPPTFNIGGNGGFIGMGHPGMMPPPFFNIGGNGGFIGMGHPGMMPPPFFNIGGNGGFIGIGHPGMMPPPFFNIGGNGGFIGFSPFMPPLYNIGGNGGFIGMQPQQPQHSAVYCGFGEEHLIASSVESCEKAGGKVPTPPKQEAAKK